MNDFSLFYLDHSFANAAFYIIKQTLIKSHFSETDLAIKPTSFCTRYFVIFILSISLAFSMSFNFVIF